MFTNTKNQQKLVEFSINTFQQSSTPDSQSRSSIQVVQQQSKIQTETTLLENNLQYESDYLHFDHVLQKIGFGKYQLRIYLVFALLSITEGSQVMLYTLTIPLLKAQWHVSELMNTINTSIIFLSFLLGAFTVGQVADRIGRRLPCLFSYTAMCIFVYISILSPNIYILTICRVILGFFVGFFAPLAASMLAEITQIDLRGRYMTIIQAFVSVGFFFGVFMAYLILPNLQIGNWRLLILICTPPGFIGFLLSFFYIDESPRYLMANNKYEDAFKVIEKMFKINKNKDNCFTFLNHQQKISLQKWSENLNQEQKEEIPASISGLFKGLSKRVTPILWFNWFSNQFVYFGIVVFMADLLSKISTEKNYTNNQVNQNQSSSDILKVLLSTLLEILPVLLAATFIENKKFGRKNSIIITFGISSIFSALVYFNPKYFIYLATACKFFLDMTIIFCFQYTAEIYNTKNRATAIGFATGLGRSGGIFMPFCYQLLSKINIFAPYILFAVLCFISAILTMFLPFDTTGRELDTNKTLNNLDDFKLESKQQILIDEKI